MVVVEDRDLIYGVFLLNPFYPWQCRNQILLYLEHTEEKVQLSTQKQNRNTAWAIYILLTFLVATF